MFKLLVAMVTGALLSGISLTSEAVALRKDKPTDNSVCDLGPHTGTLVQSRVFIPAGAPQAEQAEMMFRYTGQFVADNCRNGQIFIAHARVGTSFDVDALERLAHSVCTSSSVTRRDAVYVDRPERTSAGIEFRCPIAKLPEFRRQLVERERADPLESVKQRMFAPAAAAAAPRPASSGFASSDQQGRDCSKLSLASVLVGGTPGGCR